MTVDLHRQARLLALSELDDTQADALRGLRGALAAALHGQPPAVADAFQDSVLAVVAADGLLAAQRAALVARLGDVLTALATDSPADAARLHVLEAAR